MAFTYDVTVSTDLAKVRLEIGDTVASDGPLPGGTNLTDAEVNRYLSETSNVYLAAASICQMLATRWAREATKQLGDYSIQAGAISKSYADRATELLTAWRRRGRTGASSVGSRPVTRVDGYSDDVDSDDV